MAEPMRLIHPLGRWADKACIWWECAAHPKHLLKHNIERCHCGCVRPPYNPQEPESK